MENYGMYLDIAMEAAREARNVHLQYYKNISVIKNKQDSSLVSEADQYSEAAIRKVFRSKTPTFALLGEEDGPEDGRQQGNASMQGRWIFDPLDGTTNYIHGYPFFCSSIALEMAGKIVVAVVDAALFDKTYVAIVGEGAFCLEKGVRQQLKISHSKSLTDSLIATGFMTYGGKDLDHQVQIFQRLIEKSRGLRRSGSAALELCLLAEGCLDGFWEFGLKPWDTAAGSLMIQEAGGKVTNAEGLDFHIDHTAIVAGNSNIHSQLLPFIQG